MEPSGGVEIHFQALVQVAVGAGQPVLCGHGNQAEPLRCGPGAQFLLLRGEAQSLFVRLSTDWVRPTHILDDNLLYSKSADLNYM